MRITRTAPMELSRRSALRLGVGAAALAAWPITTPARSAERPIVLGLQADITGALAHSAYWIKKSTVAGVNWINKNGGIAGRPLKLVTVDTEMKVDVGIRRLQQLVREYNVDFIIGAEHGGVASASAPMMKDLKTLYLSFSRTDQVTTKLSSRYVYRLDTNTTIEAKAAASAMVKNAGKRWAVLVADYAWGHSHRDAWTRYIKRAGGQVVQSILVPVNTADPVSYLLKVDRSVDAIFIALLGPDAVRAFAAMKTMGLDAKHRVTAGEMLNLFDALKTGPDVEGVWALDEAPWRLADKDTPNTRRLYQEVGIEPNGRETGTGDYVMFGDVFFAWENLGFLKRTIEGSGWKTKDDTLRLIEYADANPHYDEGPLFPQGPLFVRPEDHQGFCNFYIMRIEDGQMRVKEKVPLEASLYPVKGNTG